MPEKVEMFANVKLKDLTSKEKEAGEHVCRNCLNIKPYEKVLIVTDDYKISEAAIFFEAAKRFTKHVVLIKMKPRKQNAEEPPAKIAEALENCNVGFLVTTKSLTHTKARKNACENGARIASMPGITLDIILRTLVIDYTDIADLSKKVAAILTAGNVARLTTAKGTDLTFSLIGRDAIPDTGLLHNAGDAGNLPAGEAFMAPLEGETEGVAIIDGVSFIARVPLDEDIKLTIEKGVAKKIEGGKAARALANTLRAIGPKGHNVAELGIGTNPKAKFSGSVLEVEKVKGTVHIALGNNVYFGGEVDVPFHADGVILKPTLAVDGKIILEEGNFNWLNRNQTNI